MYLFQGPTAPSTGCHALSTLHDEMKSHRRTDSVVRRPGRDANEAEVNDGMTYKI